MICLGRMPPGAFLERLKLNNACVDLIKDIFFYLDFSGHPSLGTKAYYVISNRISRGESFVLVASFSDEGFISCMPFLSAQRMLPVL